ncbi:hypothetical protein BV22DRAFT_1044624, partial [Leucogyrophana mollusca]
DLPGILEGFPSAHRIHPPRVYAGVLYQLFPEATPGLLTNLRSAVNTNATFTHLMVKVGAHQLTSQSQTSKAAADSFEVIVAALYMERGLPDVRSWVEEQFAPIIAAAKEAYDQFVSEKRRTRIPLLQSMKRTRNDSDPSGTPLLKKLRKSTSIKHRRTPTKTTLMAQRVIKKMHSKATIYLHGYHVKKPKLSLESRLLSHPASTPSPEVIDLTVDNDNDPDFTSDTGSRPMKSGVARPLRFFSRPPDATPEPSVPVPSRICEIPVRTVSSESFVYAVTVSKARPQIRPDHRDLSHANFSFRDASGPNTVIDAISRSPASSRSPPPSPQAAAPRHISPLPSRARPAIPRPTFDFFRRSGLTLPTRSNNEDLGFGSSENPIVIGDSDSDDG